MSSINTYVFTLMEGMKDRTILSFIEKENKTLWSIINLLGRKTKIRMIMEFNGINPKILILY
jgi:hypothetical protein